MAKRQRIEMDGATGLSANAPAPPISAKDAVLRNAVLFGRVIQCLSIQDHVASVDRVSKSASAIARRENSWSALAHHTLFSPQIQLGRDFRFHARSLEIKGPKTPQPDEKLSLEQYLTTDLMRSSLQELASIPLLIPSDVCLPRVFKWTLRRRRPGAASVPPPYVTRAQLPRFTHLVIEQWERQALRLEDTIKLRSLTFVDSDLTDSSFDGDFWDAFLPLVTGTGGCDIEFFNGLISDDVKPALAPRLRRLRCSVLEMDRWLPLLSEHKMKCAVELHIVGIRKTAKAIEKAQKQKAQLDLSGYPPCRVTRVHVRADAKEDKASKVTTQAMAIIADVIGGMHRAPDEPSVMVDAPHLPKGLRDTLFATLLGGM